MKIMSWIDEESGLECELYGRQVKEVVTTVFHPSYVKSLRAAVYVTPIDPLYLYIKKEQDNMSLAHRLQNNKQLTIYIQDTDLPDSLVKTKVRDFLRFHRRSMEKPV